MRVFHPQLIVAFATTLFACLLVGYDRLINPALNVPQALIFCLLFGAIAWGLTIPGFYKRFVGDATPATLGVIRILVCACMLVVVLLLQDVPSTALLPESMLRPMGLMHYLYKVPGFHAFTRNELALQVFESLTALCLVLGLIGWRTRLMVFLGAVGSCILGGLIRQYFFSFFHQGLVPVYMLFVLALTPCGDGLSVDRLIKLYRGQPVPDEHRPMPIYAWSRYACWVFLVLAYMASGTSKLKVSGITWLDPINLRGMMYSCTLQRCNNYDWDVSLQWGPYLPDFVYFIFGLVGTFGEIAFITVLFSQLARRVMPLLMVALHVGIFFFQNIIFVEFVVLQLMFVDYSKAREAIAQRLAARQGLIQVFYDGASPVCCRSVRLLTSFDLFNRLEFVDIQQLDLASYNQQHGLDLTMESLETRLSIVTQGRLYTGIAAHRVLSRALPAFWWMVPFLSIAALAPAGTWLHHQLLLKHLPLTTELARLAPRAVGSSAITLPSPRRGTGLLGYPLLIATLTVVLSACWHYRFYFYPLTGLHLFAYKDVSGVVSYNKLYATTAAGESIRIYPEDIIHAQAVVSPRRITNFCFASDPKKSTPCIDYMEVLGSVHNKSAKPEDQFTQLEVQQWQWNFQENPFDRNHGTVVKRQAVPIPTAGQSVAHP